MESFRVDAIYQTGLGCLNTDMTVNQTNNSLVYYNVIQGNDVFDFTQKVHTIPRQCLLGLIALASLEMGLVLQWQAATWGLPLILINENHLFHSSSLEVLDFSLDCRLLNQAFVSIAREQRWNTLHLIYDDSLDCLCLQDLLDRLSLSHISTNTISTMENTNSTAVLTLIKRKKTSENVYIIADQEQTLRILSEAVSLEMLNAQYHWVLNMDPNILQNTTIRGALLRGFLLTLFSDLLSKYYSILESTSLQSYFTSINTIHVYSSWKERELFEGVARYTTDKGLTMFDNRLYKNVFRDFGNKLLRVVSVPNAPYTMRNITREGKPYYYGFCYDILDDFAKTFKFRYESVDSVDGLFGNPTKDGLNATGMVGMVMRGEVDFGVAPFAQTTERERIIDYTLPFQEDGMGILMKSTENKMQKIFQIFRPLSPSSWLAIAIAALTTSLALYLVTKLNPKIRKEDSTLGRSLWVVLGTFFGQDDGIRPKFPSGKVILGLWWIFTIVITALYTANLVAFLTVSLATTPIKNLEELASQTVYKPLVVQGTNHHAMFKDAKGGLYARIRDKMSDMPKITTIEEGYKLVETGQYALLWDYSQFQYLINTECSSLEIAQESISKITLSFIVPEDAPYKKAFDDHMMKMLENGVLSKYRSKWWKNNQCARGSKTTILEIDQIFGILVVYAVVLCFVIIIFAFEICYVRHTQRKSNRNYREENLEMSNNSSISGDKKTSIDMHVSK